MSLISQNLLNVKRHLTSHVTLVAVSKTKPISDILEAYESGHRIFGENKVQELLGKWESLPKDIEWHMIGHLQSNKVKYIAPFVSLIHGVDSLKLLKQIQKEAIKNNRTLDILLQVHIAQESSKFGFSFDEVLSLFEELNSSTFSHIRCRGLMGMATNTSNTKQVEKEFESLADFFLNLESKENHFDTLSMGMSNDYPIALEKGSTMVRIGSKIFGNRNTT